MSMNLAFFAAAALLGAQVDTVATNAGLAGEVLVAKGDKILIDKGYGPIAPGGTALHIAGERWRLASITKQVTATLLLRDHFDALDRPSTPVGGTTIPVSLRQLLTHHSGLANPDTTPAIDGGFPAFYRTAKSDIRYCLSKPAVSGSAFSYNNCDYIVADAAYTIKAWPRGMTMARADERGIAGYIGGKAEPAFQLASFGAAGGLIGTAQSVYRFDRALMTGLITPAARAEMWNGNPKDGYQAIGQWVFPGQLRGCAKPKRIVQRDGEIGGVQARNYILPDDDLVVIVFTNRSADDFQFGEIWQGKGFAYDLLSAVACG